MSANTFGRPLLLPKEFSVPMFAEIDDEYLQATVVDEPGPSGAQGRFQEGQQPDNKPSRLTFAIKSAELSRVTDKAAVLHEAHMKSGRQEYSAAELGTVIDICDSIAEFEAALPRHLQGDSNSAATDFIWQPCFTLQSLVLAARTKYIRLWVYRPFLLKEVIKAASLPVVHNESYKGGMGSANRRLAHDVCMACVETAHDVLHELCHALSGPQRVSPWHALLCMPHPFIAPVYSMRLTTASYLRCSFSARGRHTLPRPGSQTRYRRGKRVLGPHSAALPVP